MKKINISYQIHEIKTGLLVVKVPEASTVLALTSAISGSYDTWHFDTFDEAMAFISEQSKNDWKAKK